MRMTKGSGGPSLIGDASLAFTWRDWGRPWKSQVSHCPRRDSKWTTPEYSIIWQVFVHVPVKSYSSNLTQLVWNEFWQFCRIRFDLQWSRLRKRKMSIKLLLPHNYMFVSCFAYEACLFVITTFDLQLNVHRAWHVWHVHFVCRF
jgi:hypothetical protein